MGEDQHTYLSMEFLNDPKEAKEKNRGCAIKVHIGGRYQKGIERNNFKEKKE